MPCVAFATWSTSTTTCVTILEVTLRLVHNPPQRSLLTLGYPDAYSAGDHVTQIMEYHPIGLEGIDDLLIKYMKLFANAEEEEMVWEIRESGLGATAKVPTLPLMWPGWKSEAVMNSLDLCLACKGCKQECPVNVDLATWKAEFLSHYYRGWLRPRHSCTLGFIRQWAEIGSKAMRLVNFLSRTPGLSRQVIFRGHCHQKAVLNVRAARNLLKRMEAEVEEPQKTCCGMAGSFGFEKSHYDVSQAVAELDLFPAIRRSPKNTLIVADGFSCRTQIEEGTGRTPLHTAEFILMALAGIHWFRLPRWTRDIFHLAPVLRRLHGGYTGDYVAWFMLGAGALLVALALPTHRS